MANNKDFIVKSGIEATNIVEGLGTIGADVTTPSGSFSTTLYTGNGGTQSISTGVDLSGSNEGLIWIKNRDGTDEHTLMDTVRGTGTYLISHSTNQSGSTSDAYITSYDSNGFSMGIANQINRSSNNFVAWTWKSAANYFDIVTYTGNATAGRAISHSLGSAPGMLVIKCTSHASDWSVFHRSVGNAKYMAWNENQAEQADSARFHSTTPTSTQFTVGSGNAVNGSGRTYVAYLFDHNTSTISCGEYSGNGSATGPTIDIGFEPQWLMVKRKDSADGWAIVDSQRGFDTSGSVKVLRANDNGAEQPAADRVKTNSSGFQIVTTDNEWNNSSGTYIYMAIKKSVNESLLDLSTGSVFNFTPTSDTQIRLTNPAPSGTVSQATLVYNSQDTAGVADRFSADTYTGNNTTNQITNGLNLSGDGGLVWLKCRSDTGSNMVFDTNRGRAVNLQPSGSDGQDTFSATTGLVSFNSDGFTLGANNYGSTNNDGRTFVAWSWKKAAGFFDIITYTGTQDGDKTLSHNLGSAPGMVFIKKIASGNDWYVYHRSRGTGKYLYLNLDNAEASGSIVTAASSSSITVSQSNGFNSNGDDYIAYLFGHSDSGPIQCGQYTGNGNATGPEVNLGFEPQFLMVKRADTAGPGWNVYDNARGVSTSGNDKELVWNTSAAEVDAERLKFTSTGFQPTVSTGQINGGGDYIYMAIAAESATTTTYNNTIDWPGGTAPTSPAIGETDVLTFSTSDGGATYKAVHAIDGAK